MALTRKQIEDYIKSTKKSFLQQLPVITHRKSVSWERLPLKD